MILCRCLPLTDPDSGYSQIPADLVRINVDVLQLLDIAGVSGAKVAGKVGRRIP